MTKEEFLSLGGSYRVNQKTCNLSGPDIPVVVKPKYDPSTEQIGYPEGNY